MLELRPTCEHCSRALPPDSGAARICSYECTFCVECVDAVLRGVCPNCGGGFEPRPIRPAREWRPNTSLTQHPATQKITHQPVDPGVHAELVEEVGGTPPRDR